MSDLVEKWRISAAEYNDLEDASALLTETKNDVFAEIKSKQNGSSEAEKDRMARLSPEWHQHRNKMIEAQSAARRAKMRCVYWRMKFDSWRTQAANSRTEKGMYQ